MKSIQQYFHVVLFIMLRIKPSSVTIQMKTTEQ